MSERAQQKKRERKKRKRGAKRRVPQGPRRAGPVFVESKALGLPKMSDALLELAKPVMGIPDDVGPDELRNELLVAALVWNATLAHDGNIGEVIEFLVPEFEQMGISEEVALTLIADLSSRKLEYFGDDTRLVLDVETYRDGDEIRVMVASGVSP